MKKLKEVIKEITELKQRQRSTDCDHKESRKIDDRIELLNLVCLYLEKEPREQFCKDERDRINRVMAAALNDWNNVYLQNKDKWDKLPKKNVTKRKNEYLKDVPMALYRSQIKTLNYILS